MNGNEKREPIVMRIPKIPFLSNKSIDSPTKLSSIQSSSSPLKLIIKSSSTLNGFSSISNINNDEPIKKKQRIDDSLSSIVPISQSNSIDEQSVPSPSLINNLKKKKKKKKHHYHDDSSSPILSLHRKKKKHRHHRQLSSPSSREPL